MIQIDQNDDHRPHQITVLFAYSFILLFPRLILDDMFGIISFISSFSLSLLLLFLIIEYYYLLLLPVSVFSRSTVIAEHVRSLPLFNYLSPIINLLFEQTLFHLLHPSSFKMSTHLSSIFSFLRSSLLTFLSFPHRVFTFR